MQNNTKENLEHQLKEATVTLLEMVKNSCWNKISNNSHYILSEITINVINFKKQKKAQRKLNAQKHPITLKEASNELKKIYGNLYDINLEVYQSKKNETLIEIRYLLKSSLNTDFLRTIKNNSPMFHSKVGIPPYVTNKTKKYDVNWHLNGVRHQLKLFWHNLKFQLKTFLNRRNRIKSKT